MSTTHTQKETRVGKDGSVETITTTTISYSGSGSRKDLKDSYFNTDTQSFLADNNFGSLSDAFKSLKLNHVSYVKPEEQPQHLPEDYALYVKPTHKVEYIKSDCTGRKRALLIGINYFGTQHELQGCINDVKNIKQFLMNHFKFKESDITVLTDDQNDPSKLPTRENILKEMKALVAGAESNDSYFLHYSGHGGQMKDLDGDEADGFDETIMPIDFQDKKKGGQIIDDEMHQILVDPLPAGCRLTVIFDSCHSGTVLDLPYMYSTHGKVKEQKVFQRVVSAGVKYFQGDREDAKIVKSQILDERKIRRKNLETKSSPADVIMFSGCKDEQTSADAFEGGATTGAMSYALMTTLNMDSSQTYHSLLNNIRDILRKKYSQKPQLSASHEMDMHEVFKI